MKNEISLTGGQLGELMSPVTAVISCLPPNHAQYWIGKKGEVGELTQKHLAPLLGLPNISDEMEKWNAFYRIHFGRQKDLPDIKVPPPQPGFNRLIVDLCSSVNTLGVFTRCQQLWPVVMDDIKLAKVSDIGFWRGQPADLAYWVRDRVEADEELKNLSADQLQAQRITGLTLKGRGLYELMYYTESGQHLDVVQITLCIGSRVPGGGVPGVDWCGGKLRVGWSDPGGTGGRLRARAAVTLAT